MDTISMNGVGYDAINQYITDFNATHGVDGMTATLGVNETTGEQVLTITNAKGQTSSFAITMDPEIDPAEIPGEEIAEALEEFAAKMEDLAKSLATGKPQVPAKVSTLCDIFAIIQLLLEVAQKQRDTAAKIRQQGHEAAQASLQAQADTIRQQAAQAATFGLIGATIQAVTTSVSFIMAGVAAKNQFNAVSNSNVSQASADLKSGQSDLKLAEGLKGSNITGLSDEQMAEMGLEGTGDEQENLRLFKEQFMPETTKAEETVKADKTAMDNAKNDYQTLKDRYETKVGEVAGYEKEVADRDMAKSDLDDFLKTHEGFALDQDPPEGADPDDVTKFNELSQTYKAANQKVTDHAEALTKARADVTQLKGDVENAYNKYNEAYSKWTDSALEMQHAQENDKAVIDGKIKEASALAKKTHSEEAAVKMKEGDENPEFTKGQLDQAKQMLDQVEAVQDADARQSLIDGLKMHVGELQNKLTESTRLMNDSKEMAYAKTMESFINVLGQLSNTVSSFMNVFKEQAQAEGEAKQKEYEVEIDKAHAMTEEADDLRANSQKMIADLLQTLNAIIRTELDTNRQIFS